MTATGSIHQQGISCGAFHVLILVLPRKVVDLRHAADSETDEDKAIDGAITPDKVAIAVR